jgi:hypothetical protein
MVLARAEAMCANTPDLPDDSQMNAGMKMAASYVSGDPVDISKEISIISPVAIPLFADGLLKTFFRFITLPRADQRTWEAALNGIQEMAAAILPSVPVDFPNLLGEMRSLLNRYPDHRQQLRSQLEESFAMQTAQLSASMAKQTGRKMNISPAQHPKFNEEWSKVTGQLDGQYTNALTQYKSAILQIFEPLLEASVS